MLSLSYRDKVPHSDPNPVTIVLFLHCDMIADGAHWVQQTNNSRMLDNLLHSEALGGCPVHLTTSPHSSQMYQLQSIVR